MVPDELRGRVMSVYSMMFMGMAPLGALFAGSLAGIFGAPDTVALGGGVCILGSLDFLFGASDLREEGRRMIIAIQMTAGVPASKASFQMPTLTSERETLPES